MYPRLCLFTDSLEPSGVGEHILILAAELRRQYRVSLVCPPAPACRPFLLRAQALGLETLALSVDGAGESGARLVAWLRARRVDLFHAHAGIGWEGHAGVAVARAAGVPSVLRTEHLPYLLNDPRKQEDYRCALALVDRVICVSEQAGASFLANGVPKSKLRVVRNGIPIRPILDDSSDARSWLAVEPTAPVVSTLARMTEQKGHRHLLSAIPSVVRRVPAVRFVWAGHGPLEAELRARVQGAGLAGHVRFLGPRTNVPALLAASDLVVIPSRFEGLPLVALEAMAAGLPLVGTRVCGTAEAIEDGVTGRLVPAEDPAALARGILEVLERPELAAGWGAGGRRRVEQQFSARRMAGEIEAVYQELRADADAVRGEVPAMTAAS